MLEWFGDSIERYRISLTYSGLSWILFLQTKISNRKSQREKDEASWRWGWMLRKKRTYERFGSFREESFTFPTFASIQEHLLSPISFSSPPEDTLIQKKWSSRTFQLGYWSVQRRRRIAYHVSTDRSEEVRRSEVQERDPQVLIPTLRPALISLYLSPCLVWRC